MRTAERVHGGGEMPSLLPELVCVVERAVAQFVRRYAPPVRYDCTEWRAECLGEAWRCVGDALRTYDPTRGALGTYVGRAAWRHLLVGEGFLAPCAEKP